MSRSCRGWRLSRLKEIFMSVIEREAKQLIGPRRRSLRPQRQLIHLLLLLFCVLPPHKWPLMQDDIAHVYLISCTDYFCWIDWI